MSENKARRNPDETISAKIENKTVNKIMSEGPVKYHPEDGRPPRKMRVCWVPSPGAFNWQVHVLNVAPTSGTYDVSFPADQKNITYRDLKNWRFKTITDGWFPTVSPVLIQTIQNYFQATGIVLLDGQWSRVMDGGWAIVLNSGKRRTYHIRIGCNADNQQNVKLQVDFNFADNQRDPNTGLTLMQHKK